MCTKANEKARFYNTDRSVFRRDFVRSANQLLSPDFEGEVWIGLSYLYGADYGKEKRAKARSLIEANPEIFEEFCPVYKLSGLYDRKYTTKTRIDITRCINASWGLTPSLSTFAQARAFYTIYVGTTKKGQTIEDIDFSLFKGIGKVGASLGSSIMSTIKLAIEIPVGLPYAMWVTEKELGANIDGVIHAIADEKYIGNGSPLNINKFYDEKGHFYGGIYDDPTT